MTKMKKTIKWLALAMVAVVLCMTMVACAKTLSGTYVAEGDLFGIAGGSTSYTFSGSKVTIEVKAGVFGLETSKSFDGAYEITEAEDGSMKITFTFGDDDAQKYSGSFNFEEIDEGIKLNGIVHKKQ